MEISTETIRATVEAHCRCGLSVFRNRKYSATDPHTAQRAVMTAHSREQRFYCIAASGRAQRKKNRLILRARGGHHKERRSRRGYVYPRTCKRFPLKLNVLFEVNEF